MKSRARKQVLSYIFETIKGHTKFKHAHTIKPSNYNQIAVSVIEQAKMYIFNDLAKEYQVGSIKKADFLLRRQPKIVRHITHRILRLKTS